MTAPPSAHADEDFRRVFDAYPDGVLIVDAGGRIVLANTAATALFGYPIEALVGMPVDALVADAARAGHAAHRADYFASPKPRPMGTDLALRARRADGSEVMVEISLSPLGGDLPGRVVASVRGIDAYPRVQRALRRARYSEFVVEVGRIAIDARDPEVVLQRMPALTIEALGVDAVALFLLDGDRSSFRVAGCAGAGCDGAEAHRVAADASSPLRHVVASGAPLLIADAAAETRFAIDAAVLAQGMASGVVVPLADRGRRIGVLCAWSRRVQRFGDEEASFMQTLANLLVSSLQRAQTEAQLNHSQRLESVGQLTGGIAHDFNNLLTVIQGNLQMLGEHPAVAADPLAAQMAAAAARAGQRGAELTGKLLAFSRRQALAPVAVDPGALLQSLADMLRRTLGAQIRVEVQPVTDCPRCVADPVQLESALLNVAINSRDAMPGGGTLSLRCGPDPGAADRVCIAVQDTGHGMSEEVRARAFEPFYTTKEVGRGTGLGLSTVYGFVTQSRGSVELESHVGAGTTVTLRLPAAAGLAAPPLRDAAQTALPPGLRVLLVEDDPGVARIARAFLATLGCAVTACATAAEAMVQLDGTTPFDLLFSDMALGPGPDGIDVARHARSCRPELPVLLASGDPRPHAGAGAGGTSRWPQLRKPYSRGELAAAIHAALPLSP